MRLYEKVHNSMLSFKKAFESGYIHWIIMYSGGKDSTTCLVLAFESILQEKLNVQRIDVIYADTLLEIPVLKEHALSFLGFLKEFQRISELPFYIKVVKPKVEESFWVCLIGKGYPPPHQKFRWCTKRLKIMPVENFIKNCSIHTNTIVITGVRFGESMDRDKRIKNYCKRGGECGQGLWMFKNNGVISTSMAPIVHWTDCNVWDFLNFVAPEYGYKTQDLESIYNGRDTRFGCWICTVVRHDKTMSRISSKNNWSYLKVLLNLRNFIWQVCQKTESRYLRPNGTKGRLSLSTRKLILSKVLECQEKLNRPLISHDELKIIYEYWANPHYGEYGGCE